MIYTHSSLIRVIRGVANQYKKVHESHESDTDENHAISYFYSADT